MGLSLVDPSIHASKRTARPRLDRPLWQPYGRENNHVMMRRMVKAVRAKLLEDVERRSRKDHVPLCPVRRLSGARCPGCGMTRAVESLIAGEPRLAYRHNPFVFVLLPLLVWGIFDFLRRVRETLLLPRSSSPKSAQSIPERSSQGTLPKSVSDRPRPGGNHDIMK